VGDLWLELTSRATLCIVNIVRVAVVTCSAERRRCFRFMTKGVDDKNCSASPPPHSAFSPLVLTLNRLTCTDACRSQKLHACAFVQAQPARSATPAATRDGDINCMTISMNMYKRRRCILYARWWQVSNKESVGQSNRPLWPRPNNMDAQTAGRVNYYPGGINTKHYVQRTSGLCRRLTEIITGCTCDTFYLLYYAQYNYKLAKA